MTKASVFLLLIPLLPLAGAITVYLSCSRDRNLHSFAGWLATAFSLLSFALAVTLFLSISDSTQAVTAQMWRWIDVGDLSVEFGFRLDKLAAVMTLVVTGVGSLIHLYAIGYMAEDEHRPRFFSYLNLFLFSMLMLVLGDNLLVMFVGWEGVGLCSYLLIGFWYRDPKNAFAGQKAFVVNRIGDAGFLLGIFLLFFIFKTVNFVGLEGQMLLMTEHTDALKFLLEAAALFLFIGAIGKSAQFPLYVWLPDAMAGPTPVSALIHAATMVTAGVYMITRMSFLYVQAPVALMAILIIGTFTAFFAATIALVQHDIKRVLAYSTVSQLGFMFMALGAGAFSNGIYHVVTHAFFKACLFMAAGSVIIGCHHEQDMRHFGGLRRSMPITFLTYLISTLAISGFPWLSGFFSKDAILWSVFSNEGLPSRLLIGGVPLAQVCWAVGLCTAFLTAFYMTRSLMLTFFGEYRGHAHPHESPWVVTIPLVILATLSAIFGFLWGEHLIAYLSAWTRADLLGGHEVLAKNHTYHLLENASIGVALLGMALAVILYSALRRLPMRLASWFSWLYRALSRKWWVDELYDYLVVRPLRGFAEFCFVAIDRAVIDATVNTTGLVVEVNGEMARTIHTGKIAWYAFLMFVCAFAMTYLLLIH